MARGVVRGNIARAIEQGYTVGAEPYHGYFFKILKGQGQAAPLGRMDFVVNGVMIGGFALVAAPAGYKVTGVQAFMVSHATLDPKPWTNSRSWNVSTPMHRGRRYGKQRTRPTSEPTVVMTRYSGYMPMSDAFQDKRAGTS